MQKKSHEKAITADTTCHSPFYQIGYIVINRTSVQQSRFIWHIPTFLWIRSMHEKESNSDPCGLWIIQHWIVKNLGAILLGNVI